MGILDALRTQLIEVIEWLDNSGNTMLYRFPVHDQEIKNGARLTVRLGAIVANYKTFATLATPAAVAGVVKADGYGLGAAMVAPALAGAGCDTFFVARLEEGIALRPHLPSARILVLDGAQQDAV